MSLREPGAILLVSCYELGHQPLAVASPVGYLMAALIREISSRTNRSATVET